MFISILNQLLVHTFFMGSYSNDVFPDPLSAEDEDKYIMEMMNGNKDARNKLIEHNLRLVAHIVKKFDHKTNDQDDLISIGTIGLIKGIDTYEISKSVNIPLVNMPYEVSKIVNSNPRIHKVGIMATLGTLKSKVYERYLEKEIYYEILRNRKICKQYHLNEFFPEVDIFSSEGVGNSVVEQGAFFDVPGKGF